MNELFRRHQHTTGCILALCLFGWLATLTLAILPSCNSAPPEWQATLSKATALSQVLHEEMVGKQETWATGYALNVEDEAAFNGFVSDVETLKTVMEKLYEPYKED